MIDPVSPNMATSTAPYYQPARNLSYPHGHNGANSYQPQAEDYELAASAAPHAPMYSGIASSGTELANGSQGQQQQQYQPQHFGQAVTSDEQALNNTPELAGLLQAVTSAVGQEQEQEHDQNGIQGHVIAGDDVFAQSMGVARREGQAVKDATFANERGISRAHQGKRKRGYLTDQVDAEHFDETTGASQQISNAYPHSKRRRRTAHSSDSVSADISTTMPMSGISDGTSSVTMNGQHTDFPIHDSNPPALSDARAAGVHSAAALFRQTTNSSRKYTRPPMSQLFYSLQLNAESFLHLQAAAKTYMLDPTHPERQNCVGNRGKGDNDMVKLRLFNCVRDFLTDGIGEKFFGEKASGRVTYSKDGLEIPIESTGNGEKCFIWPRDGNKIVSLVTPLMRRMVTNERQRMYAIETRKGGSSSSNGAMSTKKKDGSTTTSPTRLRSASMGQALGEESNPQFLQSAALDAMAHETDQTGLSNGEHQKLQPPVTETFPPQPSNALDPALSSMTDATTAAAVMPVAINTAAAIGPTHHQQAATLPPPLARIFIINNNVKVVPTFEIALSESHPLSFADLEGNILNHIKSHGLDVSPNIPVVTAEDVNSKARNIEVEGSKELRETKGGDKTAESNKNDQSGGDVEAKRSRDNNDNNNNNNSKNITQRPKGDAKASNSMHPDLDPDSDSDSVQMHATLKTIPPASESPKMEELQPSASSFSSSSFTLKAYTSKDVSRITNDEEWSRARADALTTVHMEGVVKVVADLF